MSFLQKLRNTGNWIFRTPDKRLMKLFICLSALILCNTSLASDSLSTNNDRQKRYIIAGTEAFTYASAYAGLDYLWYKGYPQSKFHIYNDQQEWLQMDKFGHAWSAYWIARGNYQLLIWTNLADKKAMIISIASSWLFMSTIEVFDGFSSQYGASPEDVIANTAGVTIFGLQQYFWNEQKILYKFSFYPSPYAKYRPEEFGTNYENNVLKDYNGQIYWFSTGIQQLTGIKAIPCWLNVAVGYGAHGMTGGISNYPDVDNNLNPIPNNQRVRQYYVSLDINTEKIHTKSKVLRTVLFALNCIKVPFPSIQINKNSTRVLIR